MSKNLLNSEKNVAEGDSLTKQFSSSADSVKKI